MKSTKETKKIESVVLSRNKVLRWILAISSLVFLVSVAIMVFHSDSHKVAGGNDGAEVKLARQCLNHDEVERLRRLPKSPGLPINFDEGQKSVSADLRSDVWSRQIVTPEDSREWWIDVKPRCGYYRMFADGTIDEVTGSEPEVPFDVNKRGVFRLIGKSANQKAIVTTYP